MSVNAAGVTLCAAVLCSSCASTDRFAAPPEDVAVGVISITEGRWWQPDDQGLDLGGNPNTLSLDRPSACGATTYNSCLIEVEPYRS